MSLYDEYCLDEMSPDEIRSYCIELEREALKQRERNGEFLSICANGARLLLGEDFQNSKLFGRDDIASLLGIHKSKARELLVDRDKISLATLRRFHRSQTLRTHKKMTPAFTRQYVSRTREQSTRDFLERIHDAAADFESRALLRLIAILSQP